MNNIKITNFTAYWDFDNKYGVIELFFADEKQWPSPKLASDEFVAMLSILQFPNTSWHIPTRSLVKG